MPHYLSILSSIFLAVSNINNVNFHIGYLQRVQNLNLKKDNDKDVKLEENDIAMIGDCMIE